MPARATNDMGQQDGKPIRVVVLSRGGDMDGAQRQLFHLVKGLDRARFVPLAVLDGDGPLGAALRQAGVKTVVLRLRHWRRYPEALGRYIDAFKLAGLAREAGVGLVHASDIWKSGYARFVARRLGVPCVLHVRGPVSEHDIAKHRLGQADAVIAIARRYETALHTAGVERGRIHLVDDAVDAEEFRPDEAARSAVRREWGINGEVTVGLVGRVEPFKRIVEFLQGVGRLSADVKAKSRFVVVGQIGAPEYMRHVENELRRLGGDGTVRLLGRRDDMPRVLAGLDILATLSGGSVMFEAMACGTTVYSARSDGQHAVHTRHDETAWCVDATTGAGVAAGLERLIEDAALRRRLGTAGQRWVREHLSVATMIGKTQAAYDAALHLKGRMV